MFNMATNGDIIVPINPQIVALLTQDTSDVVQMNAIIFRYKNLGTGMRALDSTIRANVIVKTKNRLGVGLK
jgi:hypothetical protein